MVGSAFLLVSCEHGGNRVPREYRALFAGRKAALASHRGYDAGALALARELARARHAPLVASTVTRLLVELNRSPGHPRLYSEATRDLPSTEKARIAERYYYPYRREVERRVAQALKRGRRVLHISAHSFTPVMGGGVRDADIGLLYDPARPAERGFCERWREALRIHAPGLRVRRNYPYRGYHDGLTTSLRRRFGRGYLGVEIEVNQRRVRAGSRAWRMLRQVILRSFAEAFQRESA